MRNKRSRLPTDIPKTDPRVKLILAKMKKESYKPDALIEILHTAQGAYGYLPLNVLVFVSKELKVPPSRVYSTVTFYHFFSLKPKGEHTCVVCTGTACYVKGAQGIIDELQREFSILPGQVTANNQLGIQQARCIGACGLAPAVVVDDEVVAKANPQDIKNKLLSKMGVAA